MQNQIRRILVPCKVNLHRRAFSLMEKTEKLVKYKEPLLIFASILGSIGVFGGFVAYIVQGQVKYSERLIAERELRKAQIDAERELRKVQVDAERKELDAKRKLRKVQVDAERKELDAKRELRKVQVDAERELRKVQVDAERELRMAQQLLLEAKLNENKAVSAAELRGRLLDVKYHADYQLLRDEHLKSSKD
jgi:hypothetical protein